MAAPTVSVTAAATATANKPVPKLAGAELRNAEKEFGSIERKIAKQQADIAAIHEKMAAHDQNDYVGLGEFAAQISACEGTIAVLEMRWLELSELLGH